MQLDVSEKDCEELEYVLSRTLGDLRAKLDTASLGTPEEDELEDEELRIERILTRVASRRAAWRAQSAALDGLVGPSRLW